MDKRNAIKAVKVALAIITFPLHVIVTGSLIWANNFKEILKESMKKSQYLPLQHKSTLVESETIRKILEARRNFKTVFYNIESTTTPEDMFRRINNLYAVSGKRTQ